MRYKATQITLAILAFALVACGGADSESTLASRVAKAASRSLADAIAESSERELEEKVDQTAQPLALASSRPDAILGTPAPDDLSSNHTEAMAQARRGMTSLETASDSAAAAGHRITATVMSDFDTNCTESARRNLVAESEAGFEMPVAAFPLSKRPAVNLTRI